MKYIIALWKRFIEAFRIFKGELSEKRLLPEDTVSPVSDTMLRDENIKKGMPFSVTPYVMFNQPVVFEKDIMPLTYRIIKMRKSDHLGLRYDLENVTTGHIARRVSINKIRGVTQFEYSRIKEVI